jgi:DNA-binding CsgD family transcriptional regulator
MTTGLHALTAKEKEALRLLGKGHDAKSIARHLGLSVHTIHERLRDARRKLGTSSSREAARLLRDLEADGPENIGDMDLGAATLAAPAQSLPRQPQGRSPWPLVGWQAGAFAMSVTLALIALATLSAPAAEAPAPAAATAEAAPVTAARQFLAMVDANDWDGSWNAVGQSMKALNTRAVWTEVSTKVRAQFGAPISRALISTEFAPAPPNGYWVVKFRARYANKADATEILSLADEGGNWRVVGITIE